MRLGPYAVSIRALVLVGAVLVAVAGAGLYLGGAFSGGGSPAGGAAGGTIPGLTVTTPPSTRTTATPRAPKTPRESSQAQVSGVVYQQGHCQKQGPRRVCHLLRAVGATVTLTSVRGGRSRHFAVRNGASYSFAVPPGRYQLVARLGKTEAKTTARLIRGRSSILLTLPPAPASSH
jgi:hypothetical protein